MMNGHPQFEMERNGCMEEVNERNIRAEETERRKGEETNKKENLY